MYLAELNKKKINAFGKELFFKQLKNCACTLNAIDAVMVGDIINYYKLLYKLDGHMVDDVLGLSDLASYNLKRLRFLSAKKQCAVMAFTADLMEYNINYVKQIKRLAV